MNKLKRFQVFSWPEYYPAGGAAEIVVEGETMEEVIENIRVSKDGLCENTLILDMDERRWLTVEEEKPVIDAYYERYS